DSWSTPASGGCYGDRPSSPTVVRKNSLLMPLDDIPSTCDNKYEGIPLPVVEGSIGYDTMPPLAPHAGPAHRHALDAVGRYPTVPAPLSSLPYGTRGGESFSPQTTSSLSRAPCPPAARPRCPPPRPDVAQWMVRLATGPRHCTASHPAPLASRGI